MSASEPADSEACPFCRLPKISWQPNHVRECLKRHHEVVKQHSVDDAKQTGQVRIETEGGLLREPNSGEPWVMEIPVETLKRNAGSGLKEEVHARLNCLNEGDHRTFILSFTHGDAKYTLLDGRALSAGARVYVRLGWHDTSGNFMSDPVGAAPDVPPPEDSVNVTPSANILRNDKQYIDRHFDKISYILSEFVDNSLQYALLAYFKRIKEAKRSGGAEAIRAAEARRPWIRLSIIIGESGEMAFCIEDNGTGIAHKDLDRALRQKDRDMELQKTKLKDEHARPLGLDALLSEYGIGLKNAGFFLADSLKVVSKVSQPGAFDVYECVMDFHELAKRDVDDLWKLPKQSRKAGVTLENTFLQKVKKLEEEMKISWFEDRLAREKKSKDDGGLGWSEDSETGTAIMFYELRDQYIGKETKQPTKELLRDAQQITSDLQNIYYWYGCGKQDESLVDVGSGSSEAGPSSVTMAPPPRRQVSSGSRQAAAALAAAPAALPPKVFRGGMSGRGRQAASTRRQPEQEAPPEDTTAHDSSKQPLVNIEVQLVTPDPANSIGPISLETFSHKDFPSPFERALDEIIRQHGRDSAPLAKVFYAQYREEVEDKSSGKRLYIKWTAEMMVCYCPFMGGEETIEKINNCRPEGQKFEGFGDGPTYWHGKLVPGTHVGAVPWFEEASTKAVFDLTTPAGRGVSAKMTARLNDELGHLAHRVLIRWFFNSRTLVSDDKYELESFDPKHLLPQDARPAADRAAATSANAVEVMKKTDLNEPIQKSRLVISDCKFETSLPPDTHVGISSLAGGGQELKPGKQPKDTLLHKGGERTLAEGLRKMYDFVCQASKHDEVAKIEVVGESDAKSIKSVDFLGTKYEQGSVVHFMKCKDPTERELFVGRIIRFRLQVNPAEERDPLLQAKTPDDLRQYKLQDLSRSSVLSKDQAVEVALCWLPDCGEGLLGRSEDLSWVQLEHVRRPDFRSGTAEVVNHKDRFCDKYRFRDKHLVQMLRWSAKPAAMDLADQPAREIDAFSIIAVRAIGDEHADILYPAETNMHQALRHYLESTGRRADASTHHYHVLRTELPKFGAAPIAERTVSVVARTISSTAVWDGAWRNGAFTFRAMPTCSLTMRQLAADAAEHPAVAATKRYLESCMPKTDLYVEYKTYEQSQLCVSLKSSPDPQEVVAGADMASCYVQIRDKVDRPITAMPFVTNSDGSLTMMRKLKLRRVQSVRKAQAADVADEEEPEQPSSSSSSQPGRGASARHSSRDGAASSAKGKNPFTECDLTEYPGWKERTTTGREGRKDKTWHGPSGKVIRSKKKFDAHMRQGSASQGSAQEGDDEEEGEDDDDDDVEDDHDNDNDDDGWVPVLGDGDSRYKKDNTWEFTTKLGARHMATKEYGEGAVSTLRVPWGFQPSNGKQDGGIDYGLYRFNNTCLEYKVEMVAVLDRESDACDSWRPLSSWRAIVTVKAQDADTQDAEDPAGVKLVSAKLKADVQKPYLLGEVLQAPLRLINTDGQDANEKRGNLIPWDDEPLIEPRIDVRLANGQSAELRLSSPTPEFSTRAYPQSVELLDPVRRPNMPDGPQSVQVMRGCMQVKELRLNPTRTARFGPEEPSVCDLTFWFGPRGNRTKIEIGRLAVLPGPPHELVRDDPTRLLEVQAVNGQPGKYHLPALSIVVKDQFGLPTHSGAPNPEISVTCAAASMALTVTGSNPRSFKNGACKAEFSQGDLCIMTTSQVPREGVEVELTFEVPLPAPRDCPMHTVKVRLLPPREPHHFELLHDGRVIQPTGPTGGRPPRGGQQEAAAAAIPTFIIKAKPNAPVPNLVLRVLTALGDHLDREAKYTLRTQELTSGDELPEMTTGSFGTELVVRDHAARQLEAKVDVPARASDACVCVISLRPVVVLENLKWGLGPQDQAALAADTRARLAVSKAWTDSLELRVVDAFGSIFAVSGGLPVDVKQKLTPPCLTFQGTGQAQIVAQRSGQWPDARVVGTAGDYAVVVSSPGEAGLPNEVRPSDSAQLPVTLSVGELHGMTVTTQLQLIKDRCKLPADAIALRLQDEGGNRIPTEVARNYTVGAKSECLKHESETADFSDTGDHHFALKQTSVVRQFNRVPDAHPAAYDQQPPLSLDFEVFQKDEASAVGQRRPRPTRVLEKKEVPIGTGWELSSRIRHIDAPVELTVPPGSKFPDLDFKLVTDDGSALEGFSAHMAQVQLKPLVSLAQGVVCPHISIFELSDDGCIRVRAIDDQQIFRKVGTYTFALTHTEARDEWADLLSDEERTVDVTMSIKVALDDEPPPSTRFVLDPEPPSTLYQTNDRQRTLHDQLYSMNTARSPPTPIAFSTSLRRVDAFRNTIPGSFEVRLYLRERLPASRLIKSCSFKSGRAAESLQILPRFITDKFSAANQLEVNKEYAVSVKDSDDPNDELFTFTFTTNARRDELLGLLQQYQSDFTRTRSALDEARQTVDKLKGELQLDASAELPQSPDEALAKAQDLTKGLKDLEEQLDAARPQYPSAQRDTMSRLVSNGAVPHDFVGVVGELASVNPNASRQAACLSRMLQRELGFLVVKSTPSMSNVPRSTLMTFPGLTRSSSSYRTWRTGG